MTNIDLLALVAAVNKTAAKHSWARPALAELKAGRLTCGSCDASIVDELSTGQTMCESCGHDSQAVPA